jgi:hypothetical protein
MEKYIDLEINCEKVEMVPGFGDFTVCAKNVLPEQVLRSLTIDQVLDYFGRDKVLEALELEAA